MERLIELQRMAAKKVVLRDRFKTGMVGGFDVSYSEDTGFCAGVVMDYNSLNLIEERIYASKVKFPYIPTFFAFREGDAIIRTYGLLKNKPDIAFINGHGISHPRFCGIACYIGVRLGTATIGVAQNHLVGEFRKGYGVTELSYKGKVVGWVYKRRPFKEIFISPGHMVSLDSSLKIALKMIKGHKLPEPLRVAHILANKARRGYENNKA